MGVAARAMPCGQSCAACGGAGAACLPSRACLWRAAHPNPGPSCPRLHSQPRREAADPAPALDPTTPHPHPPHSPRPPCIPPHSPRPRIPRFCIEVSRTLVDLEVPFTYYRLDQMEEGAQVRRPSRPCGPPRRRSAQAALRDRMAAGAQAQQAQQGGGALRLHCAFGAGCSQPAEVLGPRQACKAAWGVVWVTGVWVTGSPAGGVEAKKGAGVTWLSPPASVVRLPQLASLPELACLPPCLCRIPDSLPACVPCLPPQVHDELKRTTGQKTVPYVFIGWVGAGWGVGVEVGVG